MELRNRTVGLRQQVQHSHHAEIHSKILRAIENAPRYLTNHTLHAHFNIPYVSYVIHEGISKHHNNLDAHPIPFHY
jgi:hypothetical protein